MLALFQPNVCLSPRLTWYPKVTFPVGVRFCLRTAGKQAWEQEAEKHQWVIWKIQNCMDAHYRHMLPSSGNKIRFTIQNNTEPKPSCTTVLITQRSNGFDKQCQCLSWLIRKESVPDSYVWNSEKYLCRVMLCMFTQKCIPLRLRALLPGKHIQDCNIN